MNYELKALQLKAKQSIYTLLSGDNLSKLHGEGYDFSELREYQIGDDIRKINWTISAKLGKPYIKELHANKELYITIATLMDGSLYFGDGNSKQKTLAQVATTLAYATQYQNDLFQGISFYQEESYITPPTKQLFHIEAFSTQLFEAKLLHKKLNYQEAIDSLFKKIYKPSLLFVISDFLEEVDLSLLAQKHEVIAIIIRDREEEYPKTLGEVTLNSPLSQLKFDTFFGKRAIGQYKNRLEQHDKKLKKHLSTYGVEYIKMFTDEEILKKLMQLF